MQKICSVVFGILLLLSAVIELVEFPDLFFGVSYYLFGTPYKSLSHISLTLYLATIGAVCVFRTLYTFIYPLNLIATALVALTGIVFFVKFLQITIYLFTRSTESANLDIPSLYADPYFAMVFSLIVSISLLISVFTGKNERT